MLKNYDVWWWWYIYAYIIFVSRCRWRLNGWLFTCLRRTTRRLFTCLRRTTRRWQLRHLALQDSISSQWKMILETIDHAMVEPQQGNTTQYNIFVTWKRFKTGTIKIVQDSLCWFACMMTYLRSLRGVKLHSRCGKLSDKNLWSPIWPSCSSWSWYWLLSVKSTSFNETTSEGRGIHDTWAKGYRLPLN